MMTLWLGIAALTLTVLALLLIPVWRDGRRVRVDRARLNLALYEDRLKELAEEHAQGALADDEYERLCQEAKKMLLNDVDTTDMDGTAQSESRRGPLIALIVVVTIGLSLSVYWKLGAHEELKQAEWLKETRHQMAGQGGDMEKMLATLESRLADNPDNVDGWILLARSYMQLKQYDKAAVAWQRLAAAMDKAGEESAPALGLRAQALFLSGADHDTVMAAANEALARDPDEVYTLGLLGGMAMQSGEYLKAIDYWKRVQAQEQDPEQKRIIGESIAQAQKMAIQAGQLSEAELEKVKAPGARLHVVVDVPAEIRAGLTGDETVFVLARPVGGRMPLAVVRKTVNDLPLDVTLDDSMAMGPMARLSSVPEVEIVAKISKSGTPQSQPGDLEVVVGPVKVAEAEDPITLSVDKVVR